MGGGKGLFVCVCVVRVKVLLHSSLCDTMLLSHTSDRVSSPTVTVVFTLLLRFSRRCVQLCFHAFLLSFLTHSLTTLHQRSDISNTDVLSVNCGISVSDSVPCFPFIFFLP